MNDSATDSDIRSEDSRTLSEAPAPWPPGDATGPENFPGDAALPAVIAAQAARTPGAIAVASDRESLTYAVLEARSNRVARLLRSHGVQPETSVALYADQSPAAVVGILGILKSGGAYVPLDPFYPPELTSFMLEDAKVSLVLTREALRGRLSGARVPTLALDGHPRAFGGEREETVEELVEPGNLAYVIYTSGSTGRPKGVMVTHRNAVHALQARLAYYPPVDGGFLLLSSLAFDSSVAGVFSTLARGATLWMPPEASRKDPLLLAKLIGQKRIGETLCVPSLYREILAGAKPGQLSSLARVVLAGEGFTTDLVAAHHASLPRTELFNEYGPTEATVWSTVQPLREVRGSVRNVIGYPIANSRVYLLGPSRDPVAAGEPGELYIGGDGVARGYRNRPGLTAESFVPDPFAPEPGARLYRTGDLARHLEDGSLQFLGRLDDQIKIRGYRVEPGQIEAALAAHSAIAECAVIATGDRGRARRLIAYVVSRATPPPSAEELRAFAQQKLPEYMVPSEFLFLDAFPRTPAGKTDRSALPTAKRRDSTETLIAPRSAAERALARIWCELLQIERVGIHENFFLLGGDSILATQTISRIRRTFGAELTFRELFEEPTIARLAERIEGILADPAEVPPVSMRRIPRSGPLPLSFAQERIWFLEQLEPGTAAYNLCEPIRFRGALDVPALARSLQEIVDRHESLRTTFPTVDGAPTQTIAPPGDFPLPLIDIQDVSETRRGSRAERLIQDEARRHFDLARGPLARAVLLRLGANDHVLVWTTHHIISDGWSLDVFIRDLGALYEAFSAGKPSPLPDPPFQYVDFASWQRRWLDRDVLAGQIAYWRHRLGGPLPILALPTDRPRRAVPTTQGGRERTTLSLQLSQAIRDFSRAHGATLFMTLLAGFQTLLSRYSGQTDILVGTPIASRTLLETEEIIGFFVNTLVLRVDLSDDPSFLDLLERVRETALGAYAHQDLPFERLVEVLQPERSVSHSPLFQVMFALENPPVVPLTAGGLIVSPLAADTKTSKFDLTLTVLDSGKELTAQLEYKTELFDASTAKRTLEHLENVLRDAVQNRTKRISDLDLLSSAEERLVLDDWNQTASEYPKDFVFHALFEAQVEKTPDAVAVQCGDARLSYRELNARANQLGHLLRRRGVGPENVVAICLERSIPMLVGTIAVLKAGAAYLPLDPSFPDARLKFMIEDAAAMVLLTEERFRSRLTSSPIGVIGLDSEAGVIAGENQTNLHSAVLPENLAYVIYTSGSSGRPKGSAIPHRALVNYISWCLEAYPLAEGSGALVASSFGSDLTITGLFAPLLTGRAVILLPESDDLQSLARALSGNGDFSLVKLTPSHLEALEALMPREVSCGRARALIIGGEALTYETLSFWGLCAPDTRLINEYGPTETVVGCVAYEVRENGVHHGTVPIGRPISNTRAYVLGPAMRPVPVGAAGELYIGGDGLARGYAGRPDLTALKFVPDPFAREPGRRLYRSGDLARFLRDANLEFLGRADHQVKIRGHRVELAEIESALSEHPSVAECAVTFRPDDSGRRELIAYVVMKGSRPADLAALRDFSRERLPHHMIPSAFLALDTFPRTPSGKTDRSALPPPGPARGEPEMVSPRDPLERRLVEIWEGLLQVRPIGVTDNFFHLGGHSLLAARLFARIEKVFGKEFPMSALFRAPTVEALARFLREKGAEAELYASLIPIQPNGSRPPFFYMHEVRGNVAGSQLLSLVSRSLGQDYPIYAFQAVGLDGTQPPHTSLREMAAHYVRQIRTAHPEGPYLIGGFSFGGVVAYEVACQLQAEGADVARLLLLDSFYPGYFSSLRGTASRVAYHWKQLLRPGRGVHVRQGLARVRRRLKGRIRRIADSLYVSIGEAPPRVPTVLEANLRAQEEWQPNLFRGRITLLRSAERTVDFEFDPRMGWERLATKGVQVLDVPGEHQTMLWAPHVQVLARRVADCLKTNGSAAALGDSKSA